jgi:hypothetical protein
MARNGIRRTKKRVSFLTGGKRRTRKHKKRKKHKKRRVKSRKHRKSRKHKKRRHKRRKRKTMRGGCGQCAQDSGVFRSQPSAFEGPASMTGEAAPGSNHYAKLQNPNLPDPQSTNGGTTIQKGGALIGPNTMYNLGLGGLQKGWWDASNAAKNVYHQWNGAEDVASSDSGSQPINEKVKIISYDPPNVSGIYDSGAKQAAQFSLNQQ